MILRWYHWLIGGGIVYAIAKGASSDEGSGAGYDVVGALMNAGQWAVDAGSEGLFQVALPSAMQPYSQLMIEAGRQYGVSPWLLAGMMWRESNAGQALTPPGPGGTGDWTPRPKTSRYFPYADPSTGMPPDGLGWGRGLMQLDYGAEHQWVVTHQWGDPATNIDYAAQKLAGLVAYFQAGPGGPVTVDQWRLTGYSAAKVGGWMEKYGLASVGPYPDPRPLGGSVLFDAALSAYNAGTAGVLQAVAAGLPPSAPTAANSYGEWILSHIGSWANVGA